MKLEIATQEHISQIQNLVNQAYRGEEGWTKETLIIEGDRATKKEIETTIADPNSHLLVAINDAEVYSCICIEVNNKSAYIGMFAVNPALQASGIGNQVLKLAEKYSSEELGISHFIMAVIRQRPELIAYYERRGYIRTGKIEDFPLHLDVGTPLIEGVTLEYLEKHT